MTMALLDWIVSLAVVGAVCVACALLIVRIFNDRDDAGE